MPRKSDYHGTSDVDNYRKRIGKNEVKQNKMHLKAEKRRKEISESSSYKDMIIAGLAVVTVLAVISIIIFILFDHVIVVRSCDMAAIGTGVIILIVIWLITIAITLLLLAVPKARYATPLVVLISIVVTIILLVYPRGENQPQEEDIDAIYFGRLALLISLALFLLGGIACITVFHWMTPVFAGRKITYQ